MLEVGRTAVPIGVAGDENGPTQAQRAIFGSHTELGPDSASGMVENTVLFRIDIGRDGTIELGFCLIDGARGADDSMFRVSIMDWRPTPLGVDDYRA